MYDRTWGEHLLCKASRSKCSLPPASWIKVAKFSGFTEVRASSLLHQIDESLSWNENWCYVIFEFWHMRDLVWKWKTSNESVPRRVSLFDLKNERILKLCHDLKELHHHSDKKHVQCFIKYINRIAFATTTEPSDDTLPIGQYRDLIEMIAYLNVGMNILFGKKWLKNYCH